jgi:hypothetical protein
MSDNRQVLEAIIKLRDEISKPLKDVQKALDNTKKATEPVSKELSKLQKIINTVKPIMLAVKDKASPALQKAKKLIDKIMKTKIMLAVKDKVSPVVNKIKGVLKSVTSKAWSAMLKARDKISPIVSKVQGALKGVTSKVWKAMVTVKDKASSILSGIKTKLAVLAAGVTIAVKTVLDTTELSKEYNRNQAVIAGAATQGGYNTKDLQLMRRSMYGYTGDDMMATNAVSNLTGMGLNLKDMQKTLNAATAVWTKYGDSIPIEGLTESINETAQVSKVTGNLADALNWAGVSEDSFNKKLEVTKTVQERAKLINDTLIGSYGKSKQIYDENTKAIRAYNESQDAVAQKQAELGKTLAPVNTMINNVKVALMNGLMPVIQEITPKVLEFGEKVKSAFEKFRKSEEANNLLQVFRSVFETVWNAAKAVIEAVSPTIKNIFSWIGNHANQIKGIIQKLGNIWKNVWGAVGPILQAAWKILEPILSSFVDALDAVLWVAEKLSGALNGVSQAFKNIAQAFGRKDVQKALNASNSVKTDPTYGAYTQIKDRAMGQRVIPRDNTLINAHQGEMLLTARETRQYKKDKGNTPQIVNNFYGMTIRQEADIEKVTSGIVRKLNEQRIVLG